MKAGAFHVCGHSHYNLPLSQGSDPTARILDVGFDGHAGPLSFDDVSAIMKTKAFGKRPWDPLKPGHV